MKSFKDMKGMQLPIVKGLLFGIIAVIVILSIFSIIMSALDFPNKYVYPATLIGLIISIPVAGFVTITNSEKKNPIKGSLCGFLYILILYVISSIRNNNISFGYNTLIMFIIGISAGTIGGLLGLNIAESTKKKRNRAFIGNKKT